MNITRDVVSDLWPLYVDGVASADTRKLVEDFLRDDPVWKQSLLQATPMTDHLSSPSLQPDQETQMLNRIKKRMQTRRIILLLAIAAAAQAFGRIVSDTSWDVSPKAFIWWVVISAVLFVTWGIYSARLRRMGP